MNIELGHPLSQGGAPFFCKLSRFMTTINRDGVYIIYKYI